MPRYNVRRTQGEQSYSIWDSEMARLGVFEGRSCEDLTLDAAFNIVDMLNGPNVLLPSNSTSEQHVPQQQQQPQPKKE